MFQDTTPSHVCCYATTLPFFFIQKSPPPFFFLSLYGSGKTENRIRLFCLKWCIPPRCKTWHSFCSQKLHLLETKKKIHYVISLMPSVGTRDNCPFCIIIKLNIFKVVRLCLWTSAITLYYYFYMWILCACVESMT